MPQLSPLMGYALCVVMLLSLVVLSMKLTLNKMKSSSSS